MTTGYSGTPLRRKLGVTPDQTTWRLAMPDAIATEIDADAPPILLPAPVPGLMSAHVFATERAVMADALARLRQLLAPTGMVWLSWPKRASKVPTDITEDVIRAVALPIGYVDVKVCAVDAIWSGLKLVIRVSQRG
ncbi:MAG: hypothetical protein DCF31_01565 [Alphaproteobacteria bacterium]|nr:MAG: hypothetical protein DCF31_01565 [Alphaproteobacteria bacterium]